MTATRSRPNAIGFIGEADPLPGAPLCPRCGQIKSEVGELCRACKAKVTAARKERQHTARLRETRRERQARFDAALEAGWTLAELYEYREDGGDPLPTWEEIAQRDVGPVIRSWWRRGE